MQGIIDCLFSFFSKEESDDVMWEDVGIHYSGTYGTILVQAYVKDNNEKVFKEVKVSDVGLANLKLSDLPQLKGRDE